ncbi:MAG TPA: ANTAR domain-containing protein [Microlunatus sp.]
MARVHSGDEALVVGLHLDGAADNGTQALERQVRNLEVALTTQRTIGVAVGLLAHRYGFTTEQAWLLLARLSQDTNVKVREAARVLVDAHNGQTEGADAGTLARVAARLPDGPASR